MAIPSSRQRRIRANASKRRSTLNGLRFEPLEERQLLATYADVVLADGPLAFYEFNEGSGTNTLDSTGNANTGNFVGSPTYVAGRSGLVGDTALDFTPGNRVDISTAATAFDSISTTTDQVTVEMWGFGDPAAQPRTNTTFNLGNGGGNRVAFLHMPWNDNNIYWDAGIGAGSGSRINTLVSTTQTEGRWNHYVFVKDGTTNFSGMYINGELVRSSNGSTDAFANPDFLRIAENHDGMLDDIAVYDQALSAAQVTAHYEAAFVNANDDDYTGSNPINEDQTLVIADGANDLVANDENEFHLIDSITSTSTDLFPVSNLIQGPGVGFDSITGNQLTNPDFAGSRWVTDAPGGFPSDYIAVAGAPVITLDLGQDVPLNEISV